MKDGKDMIHIMTILEIMTVIGLLIFGFGAHETKAATFPCYKIEWVERNYAEEAKRDKIYNYIDNNLIVKGDVPKDRITLMKRVLKSQDLDVIENFIDSGYKFYLLDDYNFDVMYNLGQPLYYDGGFIVGFIDYDMNVVCVRASNDDDKDFIRTICHELGHYINKYELDNYADTQEWTDVKKREFGRSGFDNYFSTNKEYFAESYAHYRMNPDFRYTCPESYGIMKELEQYIE